MSCRFNWDVFFYLTAGALTFEIALQTISPLIPVTGDIIRTVQRHHALFAHYHMAENTGSGQADDMQELNYPAI